IIRGHGLEPGREFSAAHRCRHRCDFGRLPAWPAICSPDRFGQSGEPVDRGGDPKLHRVVCILPGGAGPLRCECDIAQAGVAVSQEVSGRFLGDTANSLWGSNFMIAQLKQSVLKSVFALKGNFVPGLRPPRRCFDGVEITPFRGGALASATISADFEIAWAFRGRGVEERTVRSTRCRSNVPFLVKILEEESI